MPAESVEYIKLWGHESEPTEAGQVGPYEFKAKINPSNIKTRRSILYNTNNRANSGYDVDQYQGHGPIEMELSFILTEYDDREARHEPNKAVNEQVDQLLKATYDYVSSTHRSPYVTMAWGDIKFLGQLKDMSINYEVFDIDGKCTHAEVELVLVSHVSSLTNAHLQNRNSPDMTHMKQIKDGDKIPLICHDIYDDPTYYIQIAELNNLTNFRNIPTGKKIIFPPLVN